MMPTDKRKVQKNTVLTQSKGSTLRKVVDVSSITQTKPRRVSRGTKSSRNQDKALEKGFDSNQSKRELGGRRPGGEKNENSPARTSELQNQRSVRVKSQKGEIKSKRLRKSFTQNVPTPESKIDPVLKAKTWRGNTWLESTAKFSKNFAARLLRGLSIFQADIIENLVFQRSVVQALVKGVQVSLNFKAFTDNQWKSVVELLSDRAIFTTSILNGDLPEGILEIFDQCGLSLFPQKTKELSIHCECSHYTMPCEHVAALILKVANCFDENPFYIFLARGMEQGDLLDSLRSARSEQNLDQKKQTRNQYEVPLPSIDFNLFYEAKDDLSDFIFHISPSQNSILKRLASPSVWKANESAAHYIAPICDFAAHHLAQEGLRELIFEDESESAADEDLASKPEPRELREERRDERRGEKFQKKNKREESENTTKSNHLPKLAELFNELELPDSLLEQVPEARSGLHDILWALKVHGIATPRQLARRTRMKKCSISNLLKFLELDEWVQFEGMGERARYWVNEEKLASS